MKKLMMIAIALLTLNATAQDKNNRKEFAKDLSAEEIATLKTKKMTLHLDLNESQQAKVKSLALEEAKQRENQRAMREENKKKETSQKPTKEKRLAMVNERLDRQIEMKKKMKSILNDEQYKKWEASLSKKNRKKQKRHQKNKSDKKR
ncbi:Spy/CpxP family protein refolding chaperone [Psychroserpens sp.]